MASGNGQFEPAGSSRSQPRSVAVTGAATFLGTELIRLLEADPRYHKVIALDIRRPDLPPDLEKTEYHAVDLTVPTVAQQLAELLAGVDTVVHGAFLSFPTHATAWAHELEDVGTMHVLDACAVVRPSQIIMVSTTSVYGPSPKNPNWIDESAPLCGLPDAGYLSDKIRAENQVRSYGEAHDETRVCVLRFAPILGPTVSNYITRFFSRPVAPRLIGHDPLIQFIHENDAVAALKRAVDRGPEGPINVVGRGVLPYSTVLAMMGRVPVPMPHFVAKRVWAALWATQVSVVSPPMLDFLRYLCVADGSRAQSELGFRPRYDIQRTVHDFIGIPVEGDTDIWRAQG